MILETGHAMSKIRLLIHYTHEQLLMISQFRHHQSYNHGHDRMGDQLQTFHVHESVITLRSEYFKRALNKHWQTSGDRMIPLTEEDPYTFHMYLDLVYRG